MIVLYFLRNLHTVLHNGYTSLNSHQVLECSLFTIPTPVFTVCRSFFFFLLANLIHVRRYLLVVFDLHLSNNSDAEHLFTYFLAIGMSLERGLIFHSCFDWIAYLILSCMSCLYILEINPLLVVLFANEFSHPED